MKCTFTELLTMSSQLTTLVQTFDGSNYQLWSKAMKAWLQSQGLWGFVDGTIVCPADPAAGAAAVEISSAEAAIAAWDNLHDRYGAATIPQVYKDFKEVINIRINPNTHPSVQLDCMAAAFQ